MICEADSRGLLSPLPSDHFGHRISLYADDLVLFLLPRQDNFVCIRALLDLFAGASRLVTNVDKCLLSPICCTEDEITLVQQVFPCQVAPFPYRYLGAPLLVVRLQRAEEQLLVDNRRCEAHPYMEGWYAKHGGQADNHPGDPLCHPGARLHNVLALAVGYPAY